MFERRLNGQTIFSRTAASPLRKLDQEMRDSLASTTDRAGSLELEQKHGKWETRRNHSLTFKAHMALAALNSDKTLADWTQEYDAHPNQIIDRKMQLLQRTAKVLDGDAKSSAKPDLEVLQAKIGHVMLVDDCFGRRALQGGPGERESMIDRSHKLSVVRSCQVLKLPRSTADYTSKPESPEDLMLMHKINELHLPYPFAGSRMVRDLLRQQERIGRTRITLLAAFRGRPGAVWW